VAGAYGVNIELMPELQWKYGYALVPTVIAVVCGRLYRRFRQNRWL
jgi:magnesium transporter